MLFLNVITLHSFQLIYGTAQFSMLKNSITYCPNFHLEVSCLVLEFIHCRFTDILCMLCKFDGYR